MLIPLGKAWTDFFSSQLFTYISFYVSFYITVVATSLFGQAHFKNPREL